MTGSISLALVLHNHQPVGNFGWVFADAYERSYLPAIEALERHPSIRVGLHYSGALLEWIAAERPDFLPRLAALAERGQVELLGGGWYEPVLAALPERDRVGQLRRMADELERLTGRRPAGAWLAERVWEPDLPTSLVEAGYRWTVLDDAHLRAAAVAEDDAWGALATEDQGRRLAVFASQQELRYRIPFGEVDDVIEHLRAHATPAGNRLAFMGDDGEKLGIWPGTWEHCWGERRWVERFFQALEANAAWLSTVTPSGWLDGHPPVGRVYIPTSSYAEMGEWVLPPAESIAFTRALHTAVDEHRPEARWLRGGFWRNFQVRYREVNDLHKTMLAVSAKVDAMPAGPARDAALAHLHRGQANDAYWHGLFGGIYLADLRVAAWRGLIAAEDLADAATAEASGASKPSAPVVVDLDLDGNDEILLASDGQVVAIKPDDGGGIARWEIRAARHPLTAVMRRRPEAYHETLLEHERQARVEAGVAESNGRSGSDAGGSGGSSSAVASIHDRVAVREDGLASRLRYDAHERRSGLVRLLDRAILDDPRPEMAVNAAELDLAEMTSGTWSIASLAPGRIELIHDCRPRNGSGELRIHRTIELGGDRRSPTLALTVEVERVGGDEVDCALGVEWNLLLLGGGGNPAAWHELDGERSAHDAALVGRGLRDFAAGNDQLGIRVETRCSEPGLVLHAPIETVSNSEQGFERIHQGSCTLLVWPLRLTPGERRTVRVEQRVVTAEAAQPA